GLPAIVRIFLEARSDDAIERRRRERLQMRRRPRLVLQDRAKQARARLALERLLSREELVEHAAEREDVRARIRSARSARVPCTGTSRTACPAASRATRSLA